MPRLLWGLAMAAIGGAVIWAGAWVFTLSAGALAGLMVWEVARMFGAPRSAGVFPALLAAAAVAGVSFLPVLLMVPVLLAAAFAGAGMGGQQAGQQAGLYSLAALWVVLGCSAIILLRLRDESGAFWVLWLVSVVVMSDVAGYFAGRLIGGPKLWPQVSPGKTWAGTGAGWLAAVVTGAVFATFAPLTAIPPEAGGMLALLSILVAMAGQLGDIAESWLKRCAGVKDSAALIPGHGGVLDRLDALLGAGMLVFLLWVVGVLPGVP